MNDVLRKAGNLMMTFSAVVISSVFSTNCARNTCTNRITVYQDLYRRYLIILKDSKHPRKLVTPKETDEAIGYIQAVSGISSSATYFHDNIYYKSKADFQADLNSWKEWYKENKCKITVQYVDSALKRAGIEK